MRQSPTKPLCSASHIVTKGLLDASAVHFGFVPQEFFRATVLCDCDCDSCELFYILNSINRVDRSLAMLHFEQFLVSRDASHRLNYVFVPGLIM